MLVLMLILTLLLIIINVSDYYLILNDLKTKVFDMLNVFIAK